MSVVGHGTGEKAEMQTANVADKIADLGLRA